MVAFLLQRSLEEVSGLGAVGSGIRDLLVSKTRTITSTRFSQY